ncbi:MAG: hypothetical protein ABSE08_20375 [Syntrophobacteraceae bacterium]|jgi:hypothetical protein
MGWKAFKLVCVLVFMFSISACTALNPERRKPLEIQPFESKLAPNPTKLLVLFTDTIPGSPLSETVWDNISGPIWDEHESRQIGYNQEHLKSMPNIVPGPKGSFIAVDDGKSWADSRIVIPFGRILVEVLKSGLAGSFPNATVCSDGQCATRALQTNPPDRMLKIKVVSFQVWEKPLNHINLNASVVVMLYRFGQTDKPEHTFEVRRELTEKSIGSPFATSSGGFITEMNRITNNLAQSISQEILANVSERSS